VSAGALRDSATPDTGAGLHSESRRESFTMSRFTIAMLALALIVGGYLRFTGLGGREMSADEGASWGAASKPTIRAVLHAQSSLNPGKAGLHDLALHLWMRGLGDSLAAMRALSATIGTLAILLVFGAARELLAASIDSAGGESPGADQCDETAAIAALVFAVNLVTIKYSREVRMYPFVVAAVVAQTWCFFRAMSRGGAPAYAGVALFTAIALAAHLTAVLAFTGEGLWLAYVIAHNRLDFAAAQVRRALALLIALGAGVAMLAPITPAILAGAAHAADIGAIDWIKRPPPWAPFALFNKATGSVAYPLMGALAAWGVVRGWRQWRDAIIFALLWMWSPPIVLMFVSYAIRPAFVERYLISCFVPFFILIAIGIVELRAPYARIGAIALAVALALGHVIAWDRKPHDTQWREAVRVALTSIAATTSIAAGTSGNPATMMTSPGALAVAPGYAVNVVRYYLGATLAAQLAHPADTSGRDPAPVIVIGDQGVAPQTESALESEYPRMLAKLRGVVVRGR
jgi:4-amino-4-deoxy-L-arabinose transferase-like glycosyltransferase